MSTTVPDASLRAVAATEKISALRPIFIVGMQRSGTTLLRAVLSAHTGVTIAPETHFLTSFVEPGVSKLGDEPAFLEFWKRFVGSTRFLDLGLEESPIRERILAAGDLSYRAILVQVLDAYARKMGKPRWGEKTPSHQRYIGVLLEWFPEGRIVYMVRDPRAVAGSLVHVPWRNQENGSRGVRKLEPQRARRLRRVFHDAETWQRNLDTFLAPWLSDPRVLRVRYEDLVHTPEATARVICAFVNEPFDPGMIESRSWAEVPPPGATVDAGRVDSWRREHLEKTLRPINADSLEKWRSELFPVEQEVIERVCERGMHQMGYALDRHHSAPLRRIRSALVARVCGAFWRVRGAAVS